MIEQLKQWMGLGPSVDFKELKKQGAKIIDVRTPGEFSSGHIRGSINYPLNELSQKAGKLNKNVPVITCCASGMRSASAQSLLKNLGFKEVYNGGGWSGLNHKLHD